MLFIFVNNNLDMSVFYFDSIIILNEIVCIIVRLLSKRLNWISLSYVVNTEKVWDVLNNFLHIFYRVNCNIWNETVDLFDSIIFIKNDIRHFSSIDQAEICEFTCRFITVNLNSYFFGKFFPTATSYAFALNIPVLVAARPKTITYEIMILILFSYPFSLNVYYLIFTKSEIKLWVLYLKITIKSKLHGIIYVDLCWLNSEHKKACQWGEMFSIFLYSN